MPRNTSDRVLVTVKATPAIPTLLYGFRSGLEESKRGAFAQVAVAAPGPNADAPVGLVIGANAPKPARASKKFAAGGYEGSFCDYTVIAALKTAGYQITRGKPPRTTKATTLSKPVYIKLNGIKYGWMSPNSTQAVAVTNLGVKDVGTGDTDIIYGAEFPKPPRWKKTDATTGDSFSSFADPSSSDGAASAGWLLVDMGNYSGTDLARYL